MEAATPPKFGWKILHGMAGNPTRNLTIPHYLLYKTKQAWLLRFQEDRPDQLRCRILACTLHDCTYMN